MPINNINSTNMSSYFECVIQEDSHIRQATFKVTIPSLFPNVENSFTSSINTTPIDASRNINKSAPTQGGSFVSNTTITALNHTDYAYAFIGNSMKEDMESTDGITEPEEYIKGSDPDFKSHKHEIKKPMTLKYYKYKDLNNVIVPKNTKAYGFFINGSYDTTSFVVVRIEGAIPLTKKALVNYQKDPYGEDV